MHPLKQTSHRPWPLPQKQWTMTQTWHNLLFAHWPLSPEALRPHVPPELEIDTFDGQAWLGVIPFRLSGVRLRGWPEVPLVSTFPEINVRTYVTHKGKPGVYFLSLDADNRLATALAKPWFRLAYHYSRVAFKLCEDGVTFRSQRLERSSPKACFTAAYGPVIPSSKFDVQSSKLGEATLNFEHRTLNWRVPTLEHWLTERYCYYTVGRSHQVYRCDVHHAPWQLQRAQAHITENTMALSHGIELPDTEPLLLYAHYMKALIWRVQPVEQTSPAVAFP